MPSLHALSLLSACSSGCELSTCCSSHHACRSPMVVMDSYPWNHSPHKHFLPQVALAMVFVTAAELLLFFQRI